MRNCIRGSGEHRYFAIGAATLALAFLGPSVASAMSRKPVTIVHISDFKYKPMSITISVGDTITFVNDDTDTHTITADNQAFDSGGMDKNVTWSHTFTKAGKYAYFCVLHPWMKATVIVKPSPHGAKE